MVSRVEKKFFRENNPKFTKRFLRDSSLLVLPQWCYLRRRREQPTNNLSVIRYRRVVCCARLIFMLLLNSLKNFFVFALKLGRNQN